MKKLSRKERSVLFWMVNEEDVLKHWVEDHNGLGCKTVQLDCLKGKRHVVVLRRLRIQKRIIYKSRRWFLLLDELIEARRKYAHTSLKESSERN